MSSSALIIAGPTCSGKSALALHVAATLGGVVINADAMQVYRELRILTARPTKTDEAAVPHALYGVRAAAEPGTASWWRGAALAAMDAAGGRLPILCGGTGMYLHALLQGLSPIPDSGVAARAEARALLADHGAAFLHQRLAQADPATAARLRPNDGQRIARAWEVWRGTGRGLSAWQADQKPAPPPWRFAAIVLRPDRAALRTAIAVRWAAMLDAGAVDEVRALRGQNLDPALPAMRAHGVPELTAWLDGAITFAEASRRAVLAIGQYTKRQDTWFGHHSLAEPALTFNINAMFHGNEQFSSENMAGMTDFLSRAVDVRQPRR